MTIFDHSLHTSNKHCGYSIFVEWLHYPLMIKIHISVMQFNHMMASNGNAFLLFKMEHNAPLEFTVTNVEK